jgi:hypothetical protein
MAARPIHEESSHMKHRPVTLFIVVGVLLVVSGGVALFTNAGGRDDAAAAPDAAVLGTASSAPGPTSASTPTGQSASPKPTVLLRRDRGKLPLAEAGCALPAYPTAACTGVPAGWRPRTTHRGDLTVTKAGTVLTDHLVTGTLWVQATDVTIRNSRVYGTIDNFVGDRIYGHLTIENTEVVNPPGEKLSSNLQYAFGVADYTCRRCKVVNRLEGWRVGASSYSGAGPVTIEDSFAQLTVPPGLCESVDPHGDGIQGYGGPTALIRHNTIDQRRDDCPTAPIFIPDQDNAGGTVEDNLVAGGSFALRLTGGSFPSVTGNKIVDGTAAFGPLEVDCAKIGVWRDNAVVTYDWASGTIRDEVKKLTDCD